MADAGHRPLTGAARAGARGDPQVLQIGNVLTIVSLAFFAVSLLASLSVPDYPLASSAGGVCSPFVKPGYIEHDPYPVWRAYDDACESPRLFASLLGTVPGATSGPVASVRPTSVSTQAHRDLVRTVQNRTVLLVGDVVDRTMVQDLCQMLGQASVPVTAEHVYGSALKAVNHKTPPGDTLLADYCYVDQYDTLFASFYHYGTDTDKRWRDQLTYFPPSTFESRMEDLLTPFLESLRRPRLTAQLPRPRNGVDLAVFSTGLWDLATWAQEDISSGMTATSDLSSDRLKAWRARTVDMIESLREVVGQSTRIAWRSIPYATPAHGSITTLLASLRSSYKPVDETGKQPFAYGNRIAQLNNARSATLYLRDSVRSASNKKLWTPASHPTVGDIPLAEVTLGEEDKQNPSSLAPSITPHAFLFWDMVLAELRTAVA